MYCFQLSCKAVYGWTAELVLVVALLSAQLLGLVTGIFTLMSTFYYSKDLPMLITMPFKPWQIIATKLLVTQITLYTLLVPLLVAGIGLYAYYIQVGAMYWIVAAIVTLTSPLLPLSIAAVIVVILMRFVI